MAKKAASEQGSLPQWDDETYYQVTLRRPIKSAGRMISPSSKVTMKGKVAKQFEADILDAKPANTT
jgi:hypothetical protein